MKLRNFVIPILMVLLALAPLSAQVQPGEPDPASPEERPLDDPLDVEGEDPVAPEEEDPWDVEDDDPVEPDEEDPIVPDEEDPWDVEDDDPVTPDEEEPFAAEEETARDVLARHARTSAAYELFGDEFAGALEADIQLAYFVPADGALAGLDREALSDGELLQIAERHVATGIVATQPVDFVDSFVTLDGEMIMVSYDEEGNVILNGNVTVIETIEVSNGIVYIIDGRLDETGPTL